MRISVQAMIIIFLFVYGFDTEPLGFLCIHVGQQISNLLEYIEL